MDAGGNSDVLVGIDTVAIGGVATSPLFPSHVLEPARNVVQKLRRDRDSTSLFVTVWHNIWTFRLQCSLPRVVYGENFRTIPVDQLHDALTIFLSEARERFPELDHIPLEELPVRRVDVAFDLPVQATPTLIQALRDCHIGNRNMPGFIYESGGSTTFYSKDNRGKRPSTYRSLIGYGKRNLEHGQKGLRLESRFHTGYLTNRYGKDFTLGQLADIGHEFAVAGWRYIDSLFRLLEPHDDETLSEAVDSAPEKQRDFLESFGYLSREVPLANLKALYFDEQKIDTRALRKYRIGFGDAAIPELKKFADIRREWNLIF